jgi:catechol-2,3-dioxygenase
MAGTIADHETDAGTPLGVNHVVLNVRDIEESHRFWPEIVGLKQVGALRPRADMGPTPAMRFYSGDRGGKMAHHDVAIVENPNLPPPPKDWELFGAPQAINHIAIAMPDRETWLKRLTFLQSQGVKFHLRINHGVTHSVYISDPNGYGVELLYELPREMWERDIDAGLNYLTMLPTEGPEALVDDRENAPSFGTAAA